MQNRLSNAPWISMGDYYKDSMASLFRKEFSCEKKIKQAILQVAALGFYELYLNGEKVGDQVLAPAQTNFEIRSFYDEYDITEQLREQNCVGILLGDGWYHQSKVWRSPIRPQTAEECSRHNTIYGRPCVCLCLSLLYEDDSHELLYSNKDWKTDYSPITMNNVYTGETYDARMEQKGWCLPGFDDSQWKSVSLESPSTKQLDKNPMEPIRKTETIQPVSCKVVSNGIMLYDMGINFAGWIQIRGMAYKGMEIRIRYGESLRSDNDLQYGSYYQIIWHSIQEDRYIADTDGYFEWEPRFTYHGFQYVEISGIYYPMELSDVTGVRVHTDLPRIGSFSCSNERLNQIHTLFLNTLKSNIHGLPTDCPIRERCGWTGDIAVIAESLLYNYDGERFLRKFIQDMIDSRNVFGEWTNISPGRRTCGTAHSAWGSAITILPWTHYQFYGDPSILTLTYPHMLDWLSYLSTLADSHIIWKGLDDWCQPYELRTKGIQTQAQISTAYYYISATIAAKTASVLNDKEQALTLQNLAQNIKQHMQHTFYHDDSFGGDGINALALCEGLVPPTHEKELLQTLIHTIETHGNHFYAGHVGMKYLFPALGRNGQMDLILKVLETPGYPGLRHMLDRGATTLWERWEAMGDCPEEYQLGGSLNHPFKGGYDAWLYSDVLGIRPLAPGFDRFSIAPIHYNEIAEASGSLICRHGTIQVSYRVDGQTLYLHASVPQNTTAYLSIGSTERILSPGTYTGLCIPIQ